MPGLPANLISTSAHCSTEGKSSIEYLHSTHKVLDSILQYYNKNNIREFKGREGNTLIIVLSTAPLYSEKGSRTSGLRARCSECAPPTASRPAGGRTRRT